MGFSLAQRVATSEVARTLKTRGLVSGPRTKAGDNHRAPSWSLLVACGCFMLGTTAPTGHCHDAVILQAPFLGYELGLDPVAIQSCDLNGDGHLDLLVGNEHTWNFADSTSITILLGGNGPAVFAPGPRISALPYSGWAAAGDVTGDGVTDVVTHSRPESSGFVLVVYPGTEGGNFGSPVSTPISFFLRRFALGDLDGDERLDLVGLSAVPGRIAVFLGDGEGRFSLSTEYFTSGNSPRDVVLDDFDRDGDLDAVIAGNDSKLIVHLGDGDGAFAPGVEYPSGQLPADLVVTDLNGDLTPDVAVVSTSSPSVWLYVGSGTGGFAPLGSIALSQQSFAIAAGDFDDDGATDLAVTGWRTIQILHGHGDGSFEHGSVLPCGAEPLGLVSGDFDEDGHLDLIAANQNYHFDMVRGEACLYLGHGDATFGNGVLRYQGILNLTALPRGDFNGDGLDDLVMSSAYSDTILVFLGRSDGALEAQPWILDPHRAYRADCADLNHDGRDDLVTMRSDSLAVRVADETMLFNAPIYYSAGAYEMVLGFVDDDLHTDVMMLAIDNSGTYYVVSRRLGTGDGGLGPISAEWYATSPVIHNLNLGDLNNDAKSDVVYGGSTIRVSLGQGGGVFGPLVSIGASAADRIVLADLDHDGALDIVTRLNDIFGDPMSRLGVTKGRGDGTFQPTVIYEVPYGTCNLVVADFNQDGEADVAIGAPYFVSILKGQGGGVLGERQDYGIPVEGSVMTALDYNQDGWPDLAIADIASGGVTLVASIPTAGTDVGPTSSLASDLMLRVSPNPASSIVKVGFGVVEGEAVEIRILDLAGRCVWRRTSRFTRAGGQTLAWDGRSDRGERLPSGVYFVRVSSKAGSQTRRIVWMSR